MQFIDTYGKYTWVIPLKDKKVITICNGITICNYNQTKYGSERQ